MRLKPIEIKQGNIAEALRVSAGIPEFDGSYDQGSYEKRLRDKQHLILIAWCDGQPVGFKAGYAEDDHFYSWMGGVLPSHRRRKVASMLARSQEEWVGRKGFNKIRFKTQNKFRAMLIFAINNGFHIIGTVQYNGGEGFKILLEKKIDYSSQ